MTDKNLLPELRSHLDKVAAYLGTLKTPLRGYLAGGCAVHFHTGLGAPRTVDILWSNKVAIPPAMHALETRREGAERPIAVTMNGTFCGTLSAFHPDWQDDAPEVSRHGDLILHVITPLDLVVSSLARFDEGDRDVVKALAKQGDLQAGLLLERGRQAVEDVVGDTSFYLQNLEEAVDLVRCYEAATPEP